MSIANVLFLIKPEQSAKQDLRTQIQSKLWCS